MLRTAEGMQLEATSSSKARDRGRAAGHPEFNPVPSRLSPLQVSTVQDERSYPKLVQATQQGRDRDLERTLPLSS